MSILNEELFKKGKEFEEVIMSKLKNVVDSPQTIESVRSKFENENADLTNDELNKLEKRWGDITFMHNEKRWYIECHLAVGEYSTSFCDLKRIMFNGEDKFYAIGYTNRRTNAAMTKFIRAETWNKYLAKSPMIRKSNRNYRSIKIDNIDGLFAAANNESDFVKKFLSNVTKTKDSNI